MLANGKDDGMIKQLSALSDEELEALEQEAREYSERVNDE